MRIPRSSFIVLLLTIIAALVVGCGDDKSTEPDSDGGVIMPLAVGYRWDYTVYTFPPGGGSPVETPDSIVITGTIEVSGELRYVANVDEQFVNRGNGLWYQPVGASLPHLLLAYPTDVGAVWPSGVTGQMLMTLVSKNVSIDAMGTTYKCYKYLGEFPSTSGQGLRYYYVAPNVGIVAYEVWDQSGSRVDQMMVLADLDLE